MCQHVASFQAYVQHAGGLQKVFFLCCLKRCMAVRCTHAKQTRRTLAAAVRPPRVSAPAELFVRSHAGTGGRAAPRAPRLLQEHAGFAAYAP